MLTVVRIDQNYHVRHEDSGLLFRYGYTSKSTADAVQARMARGKILDADLRNNFVPMPDACTIKP